jgi:Tol biopolymer transport system component
MTSPRPGPTKPPVVSRLLIPVPADKALYTGTAPNHFLAISPSGTDLVYVGESDDGSTQLYRRPLAARQIKAIRGTRNAHNPFFSPDGQWVGFFTKDELKKVPLAGAEPSTLLEGIPFGFAAFGSWADDRTIVFSIQSGNRGLLQIPDVGAQQAGTLVSPVSQDERVYYCYPQVLPDGKAILYSCVDPNGSCIWAYRPTTGRSQLVLKDASYARYVNSGHLIFVRDKVLMAAPFDAEPLEITGSLAPLVEDEVAFDWNGLTPQIAVSANGTLAYVSGSELRKGELVWVDRSGVPKSLVSDADVYEGLRLSTDGRLVAVGIRSHEEANIRVSIYNVQLGTFTPLMTAGESSYPQWSPDGTRIAFWGREHSMEDMGVLCKIVGASAPAERLASKPPAGVFLHPYAWSQNLLTCVVLDPNTREDIWVVDPNGEQPPKPVLRTEHREYNPAISPDGRWLAYVSEESGQAVIYLREYPDAGHRWPVPTRGATNPVWSRDGQELYYISGTSMMAVKVTAQPDFPVGTPEVLFESPDLIVSGGSLRRNYDVSGDGRFLMVKWGDAPKDQLIVVQNWFQELTRLVPPGKKK